MSRAFTLSLSTVQGGINLSCRHPDHALSLTVASESARCSSCGNCGNFPVEPPPECDVARPLTVLHHQARAHCREIDSHVSSLCLRRCALLQRWRHGLHPSSTIETRTVCLNCDRNGLLCSCRHRTLLAVSGHVLVSASMMNTGCCATVDIKLCSLLVDTFLYPVTLPGMFRTVHLESLLSPFNAL